MDKSTIIGLALAAGLILFGIVFDGGTFEVKVGSVLWFLDPTSLAIVIGGTAGAMFVAFPVPTMKNALKAFKINFKFEGFDAQETIKLLSELSNRARREGLLSLEDAATETEDDFLKRGLMLMADGHEPATIETVLYDELGKTGDRHGEIIGVYEALGAYGPALGMVGTLIGLVKMLQVMGDDPGAIGPAMAVALLTTFYGSLIANVIGIPMAAKLRKRSAQEVAHKELITAGLLSILAGENPRFMVERLNATLAPGERLEEEAA